MIFDKMNTFFGIIKLFCYSLIYNRRIEVKSKYKIKSNFRFNIEKHSFLLINKNFRGKYNICINVLNGGKVNIGKNVFINDNAIITCMDSIEIGDNVLIGPNFYTIDHDHDYKNNIKNFIKKPISIGNNVWIGANVTILKGVRIGNDSIIAANSIVTKDVPSNSVVKGLNIISPK